MELYIMRHGLAVERGTASLEDDRERPLTAEGRKKLIRIAKGMKSIKLSCDLILSSPYVRARQTAEIVAKVLKAEKRLKFCDHLAADGDPEDLVDQLRSLFQSPRRVLLVGHEPYLSKLISVLLTGGPDLSLNLKKGSLGKLTVNKLSYQRCATLEWLLTPRQLANVT